MDKPKLNIEVTPLYPGVVLFTAFVPPNENVKECLKRLKHQHMNEVLSDICERLYGTADLDDFNFIHISTHVMVSDGYQDLIYSIPLRGFSAYYNKYVTVPGEQYCVQFALVAKDAYFDLENIRDELVSSYDIFEFNYTIELKTLVDVLALVNANILTPLKSALYRYDGKYYLHIYFKDPTLLPYIMRYSDFGHIVSKFPPYEHGECVIKKNALKQLSLIKEVYHET